MMRGLSGEDFLPVVVEVTSCMTQVGEFPIVKSVESGKEERPTEGQQRGNGDGAGNKQQV